MVIVTGRLISLLILVGYAIWLILSEYLIENDIVKATVRRITAVDQIDDAIDRSVEMGRGVMFTYKLSDKVYDIKDVQYYGQTFFSYVLGMYREVDADLPGAWLGVGACYDEINMIPVHLYGKDVFCIAASSDISYQAAVMMGPDAWLLGEELYAVANYMSETKAGIGSLFANDWTKIGILALIVIGSVLPNIVLNILAI
jgi:hypothetical protein